MMISLIRVTLAFSFSIQFVAGQNSTHTDLKEYGLVGDVKTMTLYKHINISEKKGTGGSNLYSVSSRDTFEFKRIYHFNRSGNLDSIITITPYHYNNKTTIYTNTVVWEFDKNNRKKGFKAYDNARKLFEEAEIRWMDDFHYVQYNFIFDTGRVRQKNQEIWFTLNSQGRELIYEVKILKPWSGVLDQQYIVVNSLGKNRYVERKRVIYPMENAFDESVYVQVKIDRYGNPTDTHIRSTYSTPVTRIEVTEYSYYK